jgi:hypothetical protein
VYFVVAFAFIDNPFNDTRLIFKVLNLDFVGRSYRTVGWTKASPVNLQRSLGYVFVSRDVTVTKPAARPDVRIPTVLRK